MKFQYKTIKSVQTQTSDYLVITLGTQLDDTHTAKQLGDTFTETLKTLYKGGDFKGEAKQLLSLIAPNGLAAKRVLLVGTGTNKKISGKLWSELCNAMSKKIQASPAKNCHILLGDLLPSDTLRQNALETASQFYQNSYRYTETLSEDKAPKASKLTTIQFISIDKTHKTAIETGLLQGQAQGEGQILARELGNLPANYCTPTFLQETAQQLAENCDTIKLETLEESDMEALKMGSLLSVTAGSIEPAKLIVLHYKGADDDAPIALVGKGVTFDTGGISLKPGAKMDEMKYDMCGAASVLGVFKALSVLQPTINVIGIIPATENMPAGNATKPGDVVTSMSGKTIEVLNTDAEGRLILCDALTYAERFKPKAVIDIATLTGACIVALGHHRCALYSNNDALGEALFSAADQAHDLAWRMPLDAVYTKQLKSQFADLGNIGGAGGGSITAACFLAEFAKNYDWAHIDIAGTAWNSPGIKGASGRPVPLLFQYLLNKA